MAKSTHDDRGFIVGLLERAITETNIGNFLRAQGLIATATGKLKALAQAANQGTSPFLAQPTKAPRVRNGVDRNRPKVMRVPLGELLHTHDLLYPEDAHGDAAAGRWPPNTIKGGD